MVDKKTMNNWAALMNAIIQQAEHDVHSTSKISATCRTDAIVFLHSAWCESMRSILSVLDKKETNTTVTILIN